MAVRERKRSKYLIYGAGLSGLAAMRLLRRHKIDPVIVDDRPASQLGSAVKEVRSARVEHYFGSIPPLIINEVETVIVSPGVPLNRPLLSLAKLKQLPIISELELGYQHRGAPIVAVTGTNGKSTVTALITDILRRSGYEAIATGNIGYPLSEACGQSRARRFNSVLVTEVSSFQLETIRDFQPRIAVVLNIRPEHLDRHDCFAAYKRAKFRITENQTSEDYLIVNHDEEGCQELAKLARAQIFWVSLSRPVEPGAYLKDDMFVLNDGEQETVIADTADSNLLGRHNYENILAASLAGHLYDVSFQDIKDSIRGFKGLEHRLELVASHNGFTIYNDSKSTCVDSLEKALDSFHSPIILIAGGKDKKDNYAALNQLISNKVKSLVLMGEVTPILKRLWGNGLNSFDAQNMEKAVDIAINEAGSGDIILFSPGCPSYDMFKNFEDRGRCFKAAVYAKLSLQEPLPCKAGRNG